MQAMSATPSAQSNLEATPDLNERQPLMKSLSQSTTGSLCTASVIVCLVIGWCINDYWQRELNTDLFNLTTMRMTLDGTAFHTFDYPLTLAFVEFAFTGLVFAVAYAVIVQDPLGAAQNAAITFPPDRCWITLVASHVGGTFWLQALMMPSQLMSLGLFAVSRAADIPMVAIMRSKMNGVPLGRMQLQTTCLASAAASIMFLAYAQLSGCVCIWSGNGVALTGLAFWAVYFLILALPAASAVCQESILVQREAHPVLILAVQNLFACILFMPVIIFAHLIGWEDVGEGLSMILAQRQILMIVLWLCVAMAATEAVCILLILMTNSFWAVALRALRVALWGGQMLALYSLGSPLPLSVVSPHTSLWAFVLIGGTFLALAAIYTDRHAQSEDSKAVASKAASFPTPGEATSNAIGKP